MDTRPGSTNPYTEVPEPVHGVANRWRKQVRTLVVTGLVFLLLGLGNVTFGTMKAREYTALLSSATLGPASPPPRVAEIPFRFDLDTDKRGVYVSKLTARIQFYQFVTLGGHCFVAIGVALLLGTTLLARRGEGEAVS